MIFMETFNRTILHFVCTKYYNYARIDNNKNHILIACCDLIVYIEIIVEQYDVISLPIFSSIVSGMN